MVSVPCGVFVFLNHKAVVGHGFMEFPSPAGSSYFSIVDTAALAEDIFVSVPCGVFVFLNTKQPVKTGKTSFPSPTGSSYFSILRRAWPARPHPVFPSPTGSSYFSIRAYGRVLQNCPRKVSVPYGVFVFLNDGNGSLDLEEAVFPSPTGSSYFSMFKEAAYCNN